MVQAGEGAINQKPGKFVTTDFAKVITYFALTCRRHPAIIQPILEIVLGNAR
jgi:hypothetical protein